MGAVCCVAAKDRTITGTSPGEILQRHVRYSPTWSLRWDNRVRVAEEETTVNYLSHRGHGNGRIESKSNGATIETAFASERDRDSPLDNLQARVWQKYPVSEVTAGIIRKESCGRSLHDQASTQIMTEVKESALSPSVSYPSPVKLSPSVSSTSASPMSSQSYFPPQNSTPSRLHHCSPAHRLLRQASDTRTPGYKSPAFSISEEPSLSRPPSWPNESTRGSNGDLSDSWSIPGSSELMNTGRERWSFDSEVSGISSQDKTTRSSGQNSRSLSFDLQSCGICTKLLTERSFPWGWSSQKIISANELAVVSVLTCGHVYHAECLEYMTPEVNKYDPPCPVCTFGEKKIAKMSEKALKAEMDSKAKKKYKKRIINRNVSFDYYKSGGLEGKGPKLSLSSSMKSSLGKPFLRRHFSFGSKSSKQSSENQSSSKNGIFQCHKPSR